MPKRRNLEDLGLDPSHAEYLVGHAQQFHKPDAFHDEVQAYLDNWVTPEDQFGQKEEAASQSLNNLSMGSPPVIPSAPKPSLPRPPVGPTP